jgi:hypothetical protein
MRGAVQLNFRMNITNVEFLRYSEKNTVLSDNPIQITHIV